MGKIKSVIIRWPCYNAAVTKVSANRVNEALVNSINSLVSTAKPLLNSVQSSNSKNTKQFSKRAVTALEIRSAIGSFANSPAIGSDSISYAILRKLSGTAITAIMRIFNMSVSMGVYPDVWKHVYVTPVFKKGDVHDPVN